MDSTQLDLSTKAAVAVQENSGQIAIGQYVVQIGSVHGGVVNIAMPEEQPHWQPRLSPVLLRPRRFNDLLDRKAETAAAATVLRTAQPLEFYGPPGLGKTSLLRHLAYHLPLAAGADGLVYLSVQQQPAADLLHFLFEAFYESNIPAKATDAQIRHALQSRQALILLDDVNLPRTDVEALLDAAPDCVFIMASPERHLWGDGQVLALQGLPPEDALVLLERELGRALMAEEQPAAGQLCQLLGGHPLHLLQAASLVREQTLSLVELTRRVQQAASPDALTGQLLGSLPPSERRVLGTLALFGSAPLGHEHLAALTNLPDLTATLETLLERNLIQAHSPRYSLTGDLAQAWPRTWDLAPLAERALSYFARWVETSPDAEGLLEEARAIRRVLAWAIETGRWPEALRLVRGLEGVLSLNGQWGAWAEVLQSGLQAAEASGDRAAKAWVWHQLGTRALCLDDWATARTGLSRALRLRETLGDFAGAEITRHNLNLLLGPPPQSPPKAPPPTGTAGTPWLLFGLVTLSLLLLLTLGGWLASTLWSASGTPPTPQAEALIPSPGVTFIAQISTATFTPLPPATSTPLPPPTFTPISLPTDTPSPLPTPTAPPTATSSPTPSPTPSNTATSTSTLTLTPTITPTPTPTATRLPVALLVPTDLNFGPVRVGETSRTETVSLTNVGGGLLAVNNIILEGANPGDYQFDSTNCPAGRRLPPGNSCSINVRFRPATARTRRASLTIFTNSPDSPHSIFLTGIGTGDPIVSLNPNSLNFGERPIGSPSDSQTVTVTNVGYGDLLITSISLAGANPGDFAFEEACTDFVMQSGDSCLMNLRFTPSASGTRTAELVLIDNAPNTPQQLPLRGVGLIVQPDLAISSLDFNGSAQINQNREVEVPIRLGVRNQGNAAAPIFKVATRYTGPTGATFAVAFTVPGQSNLWYPFTSAPLPVNAEVVFAGIVTFSPQLQGQTVSIEAQTDSCSGDEFMPPTCRVEESNENNNVSQPIILTLPTPPIIIN